MQSAGCEGGQVAELLQTGALERALARAVAEKQLRSPITVALRCGDQSVLASTPSPASSTPAGDRRVPVGCIAKLLTATLALRAFAERELGPDARLTDLLRGRCRIERLEGIQIRHLLEHTHGLDDSLLVRAPRRGDGRVDTEAVLRAMLNAPPLAAPGAVYSYGSGGACLVAGLLELATGQSFSRLLRNRVLAPLALRLPRDDRDVCPATGGSLALRPSDLLLVIAAALGADESWPDDERCGTYGAVTPLPGWNPLERGVHLGWKYHGRGWLGHQSVWPSASIFVRAHPARRLALVVSSRDHPAAVVAARAFGGHLPELFDVRAPGSPLRVPQPDWAGTYRSAAWSVAITADVAGLALCAVETARNANPVRHRLLAPTAGSIRFTHPGSHAFPYAQLVPGRAPAAQAYLWNGRFVLPKLEP